MKKNRVLLTVLALALAIIACDNGDDTHTHTWGEWQSNAAGHWKECTAADGAKTAEGSHTKNPCTLCGYETPTVPQPATITQTDGLSFDGKVKISTSDQYLNADWDEVVASVLTAFNAAYTAAPGPSKGQFVSVFNKDVGAEIVLVNDLDNNWEVREGEFKTLYLKTGSIATVAYRNAVQRMAGGVNPGVGKAAPAKGGVFLALAHKAAAFNQLGMRS